MGIAALQSLKSRSGLGGSELLVIGYGSQGHAHALNLHESGVDVIVGLYKGGKSWSKAEAAGLRVVTAEQAAKEADIIMMLVNDEKQAEQEQELLRQHLKKKLKQTFLASRRYFAVVFQL